jgi:hypothetical protein
MCMEHLGECKDLMVVVVVVVVVVVKLQEK